MFRNRPAASFPPFGGVLFQNTAAGLSAPIGPTATNLNVTVLDETSASLSVDINGSDGDVFAVAINTATGTIPPDADQVIAGQDGSGAAAAWDHNQGVSSSGTQNFAGGITGLTQGQIHRAYAVYRNDALEKSAVIATGDFIPRDVTPPMPSSLDLSEVGGNSWSGTVNTDTPEGELDVVITRSITKPEKSQVKDGRDHTGAIAPDSVLDQAVSTGGVQNLTGNQTLDATTEYWGHAVHTDAEGNESDVLTVAASFTTLADVPDAFEEDDWSPATGSGHKAIDITINALPPDNGSPSTDVIYDVDGSDTWISVPSYSGVGIYTITMPLGSTSYDFRLRAVNAIGAGDPGNTESATSGAALFVPTDLGNKLLGWLSAEDLSTLWRTNGSRTTNVAADGDRVYIADDKSTFGNHFIDPGPSGSMTYRTDGTYHWIEFAEPKGLKIEGTLDVDGETSMDVWFRLRTTDTTGMLVSKFDVVTPFAGVIQDGNSSALDDNFGTPSYEIDGAPLAVTTRDGLHTELATGGFVTVACRSITGLSAVSTTLVLLGYVTTSFRYTGDVAEIVITKSNLTAQEESDLLAHLATKGGV